MDAVESELSEIGSFCYRMNGGNLGDFLIASAEMQMFGRMGLDYTLLTESSRDAIVSSPFRLVYGGGGGWVGMYRSGYSDPMRRYFGNKNLKKCIVMPSTFYDCDDVIGMFDERFIVFCRDFRSLEYCKSLNSRARFVFHDDSAIGMDCSEFVVKGYGFNTNNKDLSWSFDKVREYLGRNRGDVAWLIRTDGEMSIKPRDGNFDLSAVLCRNGECVPKSEADEASMLMLNAISRYSVIYTNRLHVVIAGHLLGKTVNIYDNSYGKISATVANSPSLSMDKNLKLVAK